MGETAGPAAGRRSPAVQLGLLWGAAAVSAAALALAAPGLVSRSVSALPPCPVKALSSFPCPACGSGRATVALASLDPVAAFLSNPLFTAAALTFGAGGLVALGLAATGRGVREPRELPVALRVVLVLAVVANWAWLLFDGR